MRTLKFLALSVLFVLMAATPIIGSYAIGRGPEWLHPDAVGLSCLITELWLVAASGSVLAPLVDEYFEKEADKSIKRQLKSNDE